MDNNETLEKTIQKTIQKNIQKKINKNQQQIPNQDFENIVQESIGLPMETLDLLFNCLDSIKEIKKYWLNRNNPEDLDQHATMLLKTGYESSLKKSYSQPKHLIYIYKINQMLNLIIKLFEKQAIKSLLNDWFNLKDQEWKFYIFKTMILMSDEIQMMLEQNWEFSSLAKVRQYFELYALYHLTSKYGAHVFDYFLSHGLKNMHKFIQYFDNKYYDHDNFKPLNLSTQQIKSPYGWMQKIKHMDPEDRKIKHIIHQGIKDDEFLKHIYIQSNFPHHASSFMFAAYLAENQTKMLQKYTKKMVFHTYTWLLDVLLKNVKNMLKNKIKKYKADELKTLYKMFKIVYQYLNYAKSSANSGRVSN